MRHLLHPASILVGALLLLTPAHAEEAIDVDALTLDGFLRDFVRRDTLTDAADARTRQSEVSARRAGRPDSLSVTVDPYAGGRLFAYNSGAAARGGVELGASSVSLALQDRRGGRLEVTGSAIGRIPGVGIPGGSSATLGASWYSELARNFMGRLTTMEVRFREIDAEAARRSADAVRLDRCWLGAELFLTTWSLQEQVLAFDEFLDSKDKTYRQTRADAARGMVPRLDVLTASSDLDSTRARRELLVATRDQAMASLSSFVTDPSGLPGPAQVWLLDDPGATIDAAVQVAWSTPRPLDEHPSVQELDQLADARGAQAAWVKQGWKPALSLVPQVGLSHLSRTTDSFGTASAVTDVRGGLGVSVELPVIAPHRDIDMAALHEVGAELRAQRTEQVRLLAEQRQRAVVALDAAERRIAINEAQLETIDKQVRAALAEFSNGRIQYQDYLQHYALYEQTKLLTVELALERDLARMDMARVHAPLPEACR